MFQKARPPPAPGQVTQRLASFGPIKALVFGAFAEVNDSFDKLMHLMAGHGAAVHWRSLLVNDPGAAKGIMMWRLRRTIGMATHRANAELILSRTPLMGGRATAAAGGRARARASFFGRPGPSDTRYAYDSSRRSHDSRPEF